jgi:hypothetical protein
VALRKYDVSGIIVQKLRKDNYCWLQVSPESIMWPEIDQCEEMGKRKIISSEHISLRRGWVCQV